MARVCVDSDYFNVDGSGQLTIKPGSIGYQTTVSALGGFAGLNFQIADYPNAAWVFVECVGGGGGGAGAQDTSGTTGIAQGGGSGGTYCASWLDASSLPPIVPVLAGAGGSGGVNNAAGGNGQQSSFGTLVVAPGGLGATVQMIASATSGIGKGALPGGLGSGQVRRQGQPGGTAVMVMAFHKTGGDGGASGWPGAGGKGGANNQNGESGQFYAGGGGGGAAAFNSSNFGGSGGPGIVRISVFN
uniref:Tail fiber assembly n=1 Tax=Streptomyces phage Geonosis TaxID=3158856 RepID=A0AAU7GXS9_9CAUD